MSATKPDDPIKHVFVLMLENRSFDQMLGSMKSLYPELSGIVPGKEGINIFNGREYRQQPNARRLLPYGCDPKHDYTDVMTQVGDSTHSGFVANFIQSYPHLKSAADQIMAYFDRVGKSRLPVLHTLAENFSICDH